MNTFKFDIFKLEVVNQKDIFCIDIINNISWDLYKIKMTTQELKQLQIFINNLLNEKHKD